MRILFHTPLIPGASIRRPDGSIGLGAAVFTLRVWDPGEPVNPHFQPAEVDAWRRESGLPDGSARVPAPENLTVAGREVPPAIVPAAVLDGLFAGTRIEGAWGVYYGRT